jgi:hypothetical protein
LRFFFAWWAGSVTQGTLETVARTLLSHLRSLPRRDARPALQEGVVGALKCCTAVFKAHPAVGRALR